MKPARDFQKVIGYSFTKLSLTAKVALTTGISFIILGFLLVRLATAIISENFINQAKKSTSDFVQIQVETHLGPSFFEHKIRSEQEINDQHQGFLIFYREVQTEDVIKVKMWDDTGTIIHIHDNFTDHIDYESINKSYPDNLRFQKAMMGEANVEVKAPTNPENFGEQGYRQLMEIYIPVYLAGQNTPVGVAEVYYKLDSLNNQIKNINNKIVVTISLTFMLIYTILVIVTSGASKKLELQKNQLEETQKELKKQSEHLEELVADRTRKLQEQTSELEKRIEINERLNKLMVGRELKMVELKKEIHKFEGDKNE